METKDGKQAVAAKTRAVWRKWLKQNHLSEKSVWLILYHKKSKGPNISYNDAMEEALCFGWVDSKAKKRDAESFYLTFTPRKPGSNWSQPNIERAERMMQKDLMAPQGKAMIDIAINKGKWNCLKQNNKYASL